MSTCSTNREDRHERRRRGLCATCRRRGGRRPTPDRRRHRGAHSAGDRDGTRTPLIAVNHLEAHALTRGSPVPGLSLLPFLASGGDPIVAVIGVGQYVRLGTTVEDAISEAFDKIAKMLGLPYPADLRSSAPRRAGTRSVSHFRGHSWASGRQFLAVGPEDGGAQRDQPAVASGAAGRPRPLRQFPGGGARNRLRIHWLSVGLRLSATNDLGPPRALVWPPAGSPPITPFAARCRMSPRNADDAHYPAAGLVRRQRRDDHDLGHADVWHWG